ncbi:MAG TPA: ATP-binding cassette domain-containing protein [Candidatus Limivicinus faecipullorum]|nr:ATP-binding cassette domain-containing protein [Candidatus Limivicinus faecipullorum]
MEKKILLSARGLSKDFPVSGKRRLHALSRVDLDIYEGETLALVGESGCGKSTLGRTLIRLIPATEGSISFEGQDISSMSEKEFRPLRGKMQIIFQDPYASLNPRMTVRDIIAEPLETYHVCADARETTQRVRELMKAAGLSEEYLYRYPHQFSGGQRQRIGIARAIALKPKLIICDEPVSALDVSVQNQILNLLKDLQKEFGLTYLFISHDLSVVRFLSDRTCVMFLGKLCEVGNTAELYEKPLHPYTRFLLGAIPGIDPRARGEKRPLLKGELPSPIHPPSGCRFHTRCPYATERCRTEEPLLRDVGGRQVACHRCEEI